MPLAGLSGRPPSLISHDENHSYCRPLKFLGVGLHGKVLLMREVSLALQDRNLLALRKAGCVVVERHPKYSPDLNAIEGWWRVLRDRLEQAAPEEVETREAFIARLRRTVSWLNVHRWEQGLRLCTNKKERAADVILLKGAKTKW